MKVLWDAHKDCLVVWFPVFEFFEDLGHAKDVDGAFDVVH